MSVQIDYARPRTRRPMRWWMRLTMLAVCVVGTVPIVIFTAIILDRLDVMDLIPD